MSRIGKIPVTLLKGVDVTISDAEVLVKGPKGQVRVHRLAGVKVEREGDEIKFVQLEQTREANANTGTMRALVNDMIKGVAVGFEKKLIAHEASIAQVYPEHQDFRVSSCNFRVPFCGVTRPSGRVEVAGLLRSSLLEPSTAPSPRYG